MAFADKRLGPYATAVRRSCVSSRSGLNRGVMWPASRLAIEAIDLLMGSAQRTLVVAPALVGNCATMKASAPGSRDAYVRPAPLIAAPPAKMVVGKRYVSPGLRSTSLAKTRRFR